MVVWIGAFFVIISLIQERLIVVDGSEISIFVTNRFDERRDLDYAEACLLDSSCSLREAWDICFSRLSRENATSDVFSRNCTISLAAQTEYEFYLQNGPLTVNASSLLSKYLEGSFSAIVGGENTTISAIRNNRTKEFDDFPFSVTNGSIVSRFLDACRGDSLSFSICADSVDAVDYSSAFMTLSAVLYSVPSRGASSENRTFVTDWFQSLAIESNLCCLDLSPYTVLSDDLSLVNSDGGCSTFQLEVSSSYSVGLQVSGYAESKPLKPQFMLFDDGDFLNSKTLSLYLGNLSFHGFGSVDNAPFGSVLSILPSSPIANIEMNSLKMFDNKAMFGGAIAIANVSSFVLTNSLFVSNEASSGGGSIYLYDINQGEVLLNNVTFMDSLVTHGDGGAILISDCDFKDQTSPSMLQNLYFLNSTANHNGGCIAIEHSSNVYLQIVVVVSLLVVVEIWKLNIL
jgi:hypothetical protein